MKIQVNTKYHFYVQNDTLLLSDVFNNFQNIQLEIYGLSAVHFLSKAGLTRQAALKRQGQIKYIN